jgi:AcrR family transcriptional regulator
MGKSPKSQSFGPAAFTFGNDRFHNTVMTTLASPVRGPGRPREFDLEQALERAMRVFQQRGYHATSISDLIEGMQLSGGSLYKAFKDKRGIFLAAFEHYTRLRTEQMQALLEHPGNGRELLRKVLQQYAEQSAGTEGKTGCLVVSTAVELAAQDAEIADGVARVFAQRQQVLRELIERGMVDGSIAPGSDSAATARFIFCLIQGMRVYGKTAPTAAEMAQVVDVAMKVLG